MKRQSLLFGINILAIIAGGLIFFGIKSGTALAAQPYVASNLISDPLFANQNIMSANDIQTFLNNENSGIKNLTDVENCSPPTPVQPYSFSYYPHCGTTQSAATLIYDAAQAYGISPRVILATMQKEQSLITDPDPTQSAINCAMGYLSCGVSGFFTQVDNGTWQLRTYVELMDGHNWWGYTPSSYPCANGTSLYSTGLYPGRSVTFANPGGSSRTITIANSATAALYCYTPYVGPFSDTGYSGSYNFVINYENWWGSTQGSDYAFQYVGVAFSGASTSNNVQGNSQVTVTLTAENIGNQAWSNTNFPVRVGTWAPTNHSSALYDSSWYSYDRPATLNESLVQPGSNGTFTFKIDVPNRSGTYQEMFNLAAEGATWMSGGFSLQLNITPAIYTWQMVSQSSSSGWTLNPGETSTFTLTAKNTGNVTWSNSVNPVRIATWNPSYRISAFNDGSWPSPYFPATLTQASVAPGQTGTFVFTVQAPSQSGFYAERFNLVMDGVAWFSDPWLEFDVNVGNFYNWQMVSQSSSNGWTLSPGATSTITLVAKNTGNVTWSNSTNPVRLATFDPTNHQSPFCNANTNWVISCIRAATLQQPSVAPGQTGTFVFTVQAPQKTGFYSEHFNLAMEGIAWFSDPNLEFDFTVN